MGLILLDTNVLALAVGAEHPRRTAAQKLIRLIANRDVRASTTPEVLQEFAHVRGRRGSRSEGSRQVLDFLTLLSPLVVTQPEDVPVGLDLWTRYPAIGCFDAMLLGTAHRVGATVVSTDKAFARQKLVPHLTVEQAAAL